MQMNDGSPTAEAIQHRGGDQTLALLEEKRVTARVHVAKGEHQAQLVHSQMELMAGTLKEERLHGDRG